MRDVYKVMAVGAALALVGCGGGRQGVFASGKHGAPDEFAVARQAPLVIPPDFALIPPKPGQSRPQEADSSTQALDAMFGGTAPRSAAETALIDRAGGARAEDGIRADGGDPATTTVNKGATTRDILAAPEGSGQGASAATTASAPPAPATQD